MDCRTSGAYRVAQASKRDRRSAKCAVRSRSARPRSKVSIQLSTPYGHGRYDVPAPKVLTCDGVTGRSSSAFRRWMTYIDVPDNRDYRRVVCPGWRLSVVWLVLRMGVPDSVGGLRNEPIESQTLRRRSDRSCGYGCTVGNVTVFVSCPLGAARRVLRQLGLSGGVVTFRPPLVSYNSTRPV